MTSMYESIEDMEDFMSRNPGSARFIYRLIKTTGITILVWYIGTYYLFLPK